MKEVKDYFKFTEEVKKTKENLDKIGEYLIDK